MACSSLISVVLSIPRSHVTLQSGGEIMPARSFREPDPRHSISALSSM